MTLFHCCFPAFSRNRESSQRDSQSVWEKQTEHQSHSKPKGKSLGTDLSGWEKKKRIRQGINEMGLALEWKSGYQLGVTLIACQTIFDYDYSSLFTTYVRCSWWMILKLLFYYQVWYVVNCSTILVCTMLSVKPKINYILNYDAICQSNLLIIIPW